MEKINGPQGTTCYRISNPGGSEVVISRHGGHLISWKTACGTERLYVSPDAEFESGKAIRGGVPIIFPQFNENGLLSRHGFARKSEWTADLEKPVIKLRSNEATRDEWPFEFELTLGVALSDETLEIIFTVENTGPDPFSFQAALHSYFAVQDIGLTRIEGLEGSEFENAVSKQAELGERVGITFGAEVDRAYRKAESQEVRIREKGARDSLVISSGNFPDFVIWNPGPQHGIGDLPVDDWQKFVCVESAQVQNASPLLPGQQWTGRQILRVETQ